MEMESGGMMRWLLTYADMLTLLFALFIILYAMSSTDSAKARAVSLALQKTFGILQGSAGLLEGSGRDDNTSYNFIQPQGSKSGPSGLQYRLKRAMQGQKGMILREDERGLIITLLTDGMLFVKGDAALLDGAKLGMADVLQVLKDQPYPILVEGHTCNLPINTEAFPSNWELSAARATSVVKYLIEDEGIDSARLSAAGYGEFRPLWPNNDETNRRLNRRVDIVILREELGGRGFRRDQGS